MRILILGADGYLGWPTAMHLAARGHEVIAVDSYLRRQLCREVKVEPLFEVPELAERCAIWQELTGGQIEHRIGDLNEWEFIAGIFRDFEPQAVVHYAEQPAAPYSMLNRQAATLTLRNNLLVTANVIFAVKEFSPDAHVIKLGTMGEYGTPNIDIEEGWLEVVHNGRQQKFLYPRQAGSLYHTTKIMDTDLLWFYVRMWNLRVTDLMQGPVYGMFTEETEKDDRLLPFFNYDEIFGTVLNRFVVQAVAGFPLTVFGKGGQTRGFLNIKDTLNCIRLSVENPADKGELRIFNQFTETFSINELAQKVKAAGSKLDLVVKIQHVDNPRLEAEEHYYNPRHTGLMELGLKPHCLSEDVLAQMMAFVKKNKTQIRPDQFYPKIKWA
jgi:UDP-sulfoquinovose synthase